MAKTMQSELEGNLQVAEDIPRVRNAQKSELRIRLIFAVSALALVSACGQKGPPITVDAADLYGAFLSNADAASAQFGGHELVVSGVAGGVQSGVLTIIPGVQANMSSSAEAVSLGEKVTVRCGSVRGGQEVRLFDCSLESTSPITLDDVSDQLAETQRKMVSREVGPTEGAGLQLGPPDALGARAAIATGKVVRVEIESGLRVLHLDIGSPPKNVSAWMTDGSAADSLTPGQSVTVDCQDYSEGDSGPQLGQCQLR